MKSETISKYYRLLQAIAKKEKLTSKEFIALVKEHKCSTSIGTILCNGGVINRRGRVYHWVSPVCSIDTTVKALQLLHKYNKTSNKRRLAKKVISVANKNKPETMPQQIETMPQRTTYSEIDKLFGTAINEAPAPKPEEPKVFERPVENRLKSKITWLWGLYSKTEWYAPTNER
jgi:hypothetical protein